MASANKQSPETLENWAMRVMSDGFSAECFEMRAPLECNCGHLRTEEIRIKRKFDLLPPGEKSKKIDEYDELIRQVRIRKMNAHKKCKKTLMESSARLLAEKIGIPPVYHKYNPQNPKIIPDPNTTPEQHHFHRIKPLYWCSGENAGGKGVVDKEVADYEIHDTEEQVGNFTRREIGTEGYFQREEQRWFFNDKTRFNNADEIASMIPQFESRVCRVSIAVWVLKQWQKERWFANFTDEMKKECRQFVEAGTSLVINELQRIAAAEYQRKKLTNSA